MNNITQFQVIDVDKQKKMVSVAYGSIKFYCSVAETPDGRIMVTKPSSLYVEQPDFYEMVLTVRRAWKAS